MTETNTTSETVQQKTGLNHTLQAAVREARDWARQYPRLGLGLLAGMLMVGAGGAFAIATPVRDDTLVVRQILQEVQPAVALSTQQAGLRGHNFVLYRSTDSREGDTAASLLTRLGVSDAAAERWLRSTDAVRAEMLGHGQRLVQAEVLPDQRLQKLRVLWLDADQPYQYRELVINRTEQGFGHAVQTGKVEVQAELANVTLGGNYFRSTTAAGVPTKVAQQLLDLFDPQIDIQKAGRKGDQLSLAYERLSVAGQTLGHGRLLNADVQVQGQDYRAVWFDGKGPGGGKYYAPDGQGLELAYVSPIPGGAMITSQFEPYRVHPVFGNTRPHTGVDFRASVGTPIVAVADGTVSFAGTQTGYGSVIIIQHANKQSTLYAHLSQIGVAVGQPVKQGSLIGKAGETGWATGPHLHFETRDNDVPQNPEVVLAERRANSLPTAQRGAFNKVVAEAQRNWDQAQSIRLASAQ